MRLAKSLPHRSPFRIIDEDSQQATQVQVTERMVDIARVFAEMLKAAWLEPVDSLAHSNSVLLLQNVAGDFREKAASRFDISQAVQEDADLVEDVGHQHGRTR